MRYEEGVCLSLRERRDGAFGRAPLFASLTPACMPGPRKWFQVHTSCCINPLTKSWSTRPFEAHAWPPLVPLCQYKLRQAAVQGYAQALMAARQSLRRAHRGRNTVASAGLLTSLLMLAMMMAVLRLMGVSLERRPRMSSGTMMDSAGLSTCCRPPQG